MGCKDIYPGNYENRVIFYGINNVPDELKGTWKLASFLNGNGYGGPSGNWDMSTGVHNLELNCIGNIMIVKKDGSTLGSWDATGYTNFSPTTVRFQYWFGDSEFANFQLCDSNGCDDITPTPTPTPTDTPTSTPTPTPTPTEAPTPTPTPTPPPSKKVVIVPGLGASWNKDAILYCKASNYKGNWKLAFYAEKYYKPLYTVLSDEGYTISPYYYDWRKTVPTHANSLNTFIANITDDGEKINLLGHSMGGLLGRSYLELVREQNELSKFLSIGSPHRGVSSSYPAWSGGAIWEKDLLRRIAMTLVIKECEHYNTLRKTIRKFFPSIQNLLRIDDYLRNNATGQLKSVASMIAQNNWLPTDNFTPPFYGVTVGSLTGVDQQTLDVIRVKKRSAIDATLGNWADGKPVSQEYSYNGDNTVLAQSSDIPGSIITHIPQDHTDLIHSNDGYQAILQFLNPNVNFKPVSNTLLQKPTSAIIIIADPATAEAVSPDGVTQSSDEGTIAIYNPKSGNYKLKFNPKSSTTKIIVAQFLEDGRVLWKEYNLAGSKTMQKSLQYNPLNPQEDPLK